MRSRFGRMARICSFGAAVTTAGLLIACSDLVAPTSESSTHPQVRFDYGYPSCGGLTAAGDNWSVEECETMLDGINILRERGDPACDELADMVQDLFDRKKLYNGGSYVDTRWGGGVAIYDNDEILLGPGALAQGSRHAADVLSHEASHEGWSTKHPPEDTGGWNNASSVGQYCAGYTGSIF